MAPKSKSAVRQAPAAGDAVDASTQPTSAKVSKGKGKAGAKPVTAFKPQADAVDDALGDHTADGQFTDAPTWEWTTLSERSVSKHPAVFTHDAKCAANFSRSGTLLLTSYTADISSL